MIGLLRTVMIMLGVTWILSMLFMGLAFSLAVNERRRQIGVLRALGASQATVLKSLLAESTLLATAGGLTGNLLTVLLIIPLQGRSPAWPACRCCCGADSLPRPHPQPAAGPRQRYPGRLPPRHRISRQEPALVMRE